MTDHFVVEADRRVVGLAVRVPGGFRFFASDPDYLELDARTFARARQISRKVAEIARLRREPKPAMPRAGLARARRARRRRSG